MNVGRAFLLNTITLLISSLACFGIFKTDSTFSTASSFFILLCCVCLITGVVYYKSVIIINTLDKLGIGFILFLVTKGCINSIIDITIIGYLIFLILLYISFKKISPIINKYWQYYIGSLLLSLLLFLVFAVYHCFFLKESLDNFYFPNKTILGIVVAAKMCFLVPLFLTFNNKYFAKKFVKYLSLSIFCGSFILLLATSSRSAWLGLAAAISFVLLIKYKHKFSKTITMSAVTMGFIMLSAFLYFYKQDSSNGRLLIYKVSATTLKNNWVFGIGVGQFKVQYNQNQAHYFTTHSIDNKEALLADNSYYAFNDYFQIIVENGIVAIIFIVYFGILLFKQIKKAVSSDTPFSIAAAASAICILVAALFSYPLQFLPLLTQLLFCLAFINSNEQDKNLVLSNKFSNLALVIVSVLCLLYFFLLNSYQLKAKQAEGLSRIGYKIKALEKYAELTNYYFKDGNILYNYAKELYYTKQLKEANEIVKIAKTQFSNNEFTRLSAAINNELQNFEQAEKDYKTAVYMVPNRMISRDELLNFYLERKDTANAIYWAKSIINMPVKIPSQITANIQQKAKETLIKLNR